MSDIQIKEISELDIKKFDALAYQSGAFFCQSSWVSAFGKNSKFIGFFDANNILRGGFCVEVK